MLLPALLNAASITGGLLLLHHPPSVGCIVLHDWGTEMGSCSDVGLCG